METTVTPFDFINSLKILKIRSENCTVNKLQHLFDDKDIIELLTFFCNNITSENLLSNDELTCFMYLEDKNLVLDDDDLEQAMYEIEHKYPQLLELDEEDLCFIKEEFEEEKKYLQDLESLIDIEIGNNANLDDDIRLLEEENIKLSASSEIHYENLMKLSTNLNNSQDILKKSIFDLRKFFQTSFISYIDGFIQNSKPNIELLQNLLYNYMKTAFNNIQSRAYPNNLLLANLNTLKSSLKESFELNVIALCELQYQKQVYEAMKSLDVSKLSNSHIEYEILRMQKRVEQLQQDISSMNCCSKVYIEQMADNEISSVMVKFTAAKLERCLKTQEKITNLSNHVINVRNQCRILDGFLHFVFDGLVQNQHTILDTIRQLSNDQLYLNMRLKQMDLIIDEYTNVQLQPILQRNEFLQILSKIVRNNDDSEPENLICLSQNCEQIEMNFKRKQKQIFKLESELLKNVIMPLKKKIKPKLKLLFTDEHSNRIVSDDINVLKIVYQIEKQLEVETETLQTLTNKLKKIMKQLSNDKWFKYHHFLWVWFLINPKKVHKVLKEIKDEISK